MRRLSLTRLQAGRAFAGAVQTHHPFGGSSSARRWNSEPFRARTVLLPRLGRLAKAPSPPGWLAPADIGKNPARRGFCFSAADSAIFPVEDEWHVSHPPPWLAI